MNPPDISAVHNRSLPVAVVGLGYVGLPLAVAFARQAQVIAFDIDPGRIRELQAGHDRTREVDPEALAACAARFTSDPASLSEAGVIIVAVPTPIDSHCNPDLTPVLKASETVGRNMAQGCIVVYESTVYPGVTEDICVPILEAGSGLTHGRDFSVGYSPERINPGDKEHTLATIVKVVSGSTPAVCDFLADLYGLVVAAGIHRAPSIRVAEAAKAIENTQRDLNIALMNELSMFFHCLAIDTLEVLRAASTKWNFLPFKPGLVGGHCIGVDPYYLTYKAEEVGFMPQLIAAGRRVNDGMGKYVAEHCVKLLIASDCLVRGARVGIFGLTFKEDIPDLRNSRVIDIIHELDEYGVTCLVHDAFADPAEARSFYDVDLVPLEAMTEMDALILAVPHAPYRDMTPERLAACFRKAEAPILLDIKGLYDASALRARGFTVWRL